MSQLRPQQARPLCCCAVSARRTSEDALVPVLVLCSPKQHPGCAMAGLGAGGWALTEPVSCVRRARRESCKAWSSYPWPYPLSHQRPLSLIDFFPL